MRILLFIAFCCVFQWSDAQIMRDSLDAEKNKKDRYYYATGLGFGYSSEKLLPFWMQTNKFGLVPRENYGLWDFELGKKMETSKNFDWEFGIMAAASVADETDIRFRDYYVGVRYHKISLFVGAKADPIIYEGLSSTNGSFIWSANARPYPKISIEIPYIDVPFTKGILKFKGAFSEGVMYDDRYVDKPHVHHKNLYLKAEKGRFAVEFGLNHYAQWAGNSPRFGKLPSSFGAYKDMFFASDNSDYDQIAASFDKNRVGNHLGMLDGRFHYCMVFILEEQKKKPGCNHSFWNITIRKNNLERRPERNRERISYILDKIIILIKVFIARVGRVMVTRLEFLSLLQFREITML